MARQGRESFFSYLEDAEAQGWDSIWFSDRLIGPAWTVEPLVAMAMTAARTTRLKFGTGVLLMSMRSPVATARSLATIDVLSGGRLVVGVGVGQESPLEYDAMGVRKGERGRRLNEAIRVMRRLWTEERITYHGQYLQIEEAGLSPMPKQRPIPLWVGGRTEAAFRRTGELGDGWLATQITAEEAAQAVARIQSHAANAGRHIDDDHFGLWTASYVVERGQVPMERVGQHLLRRRQDVGPEQLYMLGTPDQVAARVQEYVEAGVTKFVFTPACSPDEMAEQMALQAETVVKALHAVAV